MSRAIVLLVFASAAGQAAVVALRAEADTTVAAEDGLEAARHKRFRTLAESYTVFVNTKAEAEAKLRDEPIFRWSNPERRAVAGALYLWTHEGRPHATIGVWTYRDTKDSHELQSLATGPFVSRNEKQPAWNPRKAGLEFAPLDAALPATDSESRRLVQMRALAHKHFSAKLTRNTASGPQVETLRLVPQPIYRYEELPPGVIDGAMFSFAQGTDPEVFLLLEVREDEKKTQWYYAFAPATSNRVSGSLNEKQVWDNTSQVSDGTFVMYLYVDQ